MKILWFANTPANGDEYLNNELKGTGGWLKALDKEIQQKIDLSVSFYYNTNMPFRYRNTNYYPIKLHKDHLQNLSRIFTNHITGEEDIKKHLDIINQVKPDIIHIHGTENPFGYIIDKTNIPVVVSIQGNITVCHHKFFSGIEQRFANIKERKGNLHEKILFQTSFSKKYKIFTKMKERETQWMNKCKYIIGRTKWDYRITRILSPDSAYFHGDEILRDGFYQNEWKPKNNKKLIIHTTNGNSPYKGFETICHSLKLLNDLNIDIEWRVAGINEDDLIVKVVKKKLQNNYPSKGLVLLGRLNEKELIKKLLEADMYIMPSHIENSPNNLCEAMILGMPCIATYAGGTGSLLSDGEEGILIQDGDPWVMAGAVLEMRNNYSESVRLGINARKRALLRHDPKEIATSYLVDIYQKILPGHH